MNTPHLVKWAFKILPCVLITNFYANMSFAQFGEGLAPPSARSAIDSKGIDLISGNPNIGGMSVSIGTKESGIKSDPAGQRYGNDNFTGSLTKLIVRTPWSAPKDVDGLPVGTYIKVDSLGHSEYFIVNGSTYTNYKQTGGSFSCSGNICTYITTDGTTVLFDQTITNGFSQNYPSDAANYTTSTNVGFQTKITKPDGEVINLSYISIANYGGRMISGVSSSLGWMLKYYFGPKTWVNSDGNATQWKVTSSRSVKAVNTSIEYCDPLSASCNTSNSWPTSTMSGQQTLIYSSPVPAPLGTPSSSYNTTIISTTVTNPLNQSDSYNQTIGSYDGVNDSYVSPGGITYSYYKPGFAYYNGQYSPTSLTGKVQRLTVGNQYYFDYNFASNTSPDGSFEINTVTSRLKSFTDNLNRKSNYLYDHWGNNVTDLIDPDATPSITSPTGGYSHYVRDVRGNITSVTTYPKNGGTPLVMYATYPEQGVLVCSNPKTCNKPLTVTDQNGVTTTFEYDPVHGGLKTVTKPAVNGVQARTTYSYEQKTPYVKNSSGSSIAGAPVWRLVSISKCMTANSCAGTADELRTEYSNFDNNLNVKTTTIKHGDNSVVLATNREFDIYGNITSVDGPRPGNYDTTYYFYDSLHQKVGEIGPDPDGPGPLPRQATRMGTYNSGTGKIEGGYNGDGKILSVEKGIVQGTAISDLGAMSASEKTAYSYNSVHGLVEFERYYAAGVLQKLVQKNYDTNFRLNCVAQRFSFSTSLDACTPGTATEVYPVGRNVTVNDRVIKYTYDSAGALLTTTNAYGTANARVDHSRTFLAANGLMDSESDGNGNKTTYQYDDFKRAFKTIYPDASYTQTGFTNSFVSSLRLRDGQTISLTPDALGRVSAKSGAVSESFTYDNFDQVTSHTNNSTGGVAATTNYKRKAIGWLEFEDTALGRVSYDYDSYGRKTKLMWPDNFYINYVYDTSGYAGDYLKQIKESGGAVVASFDYYDTGRRKTLTRGNGVVTSYAYDSIQRLQSLATDVGGASTSDDISESFSYTLSGQLKSRTLTAENSGYVFSATTASSTSYAPNSLNQIASVGGTVFGYDLRGNLTSDNAGASYTYNANNLLLNATKSGVTTTLTYDAENRLYSVQNNTKFMYDGSDLIAETNGSNTILRRYIHGPETDDPIAWYEGTGTSDKRYYSTDRQGSIIGTTSQSGAQLATNAYDEYGNQKSSAVGRFEYTGQTWIPELGLYYYKARFYSPSFGRFLQTDPIGYKDNLNLYAYVGNDPINKTDPTGLARCDQTLSQAECEIALTDSDNARDNARNAAKGLDDVVNRMKSGTVTAADKAAIKVAGDKFGKQFTSEKGLTRLANGLNKAADRIGARGEGAVLSQGNNWGSTVTGYVIPYGDTIHLNDYYFDSQFSDETRQRSMLHEASHLAHFFGDDYIRDGDNPRFNKSSAWRNADTYACFVYPSTCGL